jgi:hypothetical protein
VNFRALIKSIFHRSGFDIVRFVPELNQPFPILPLVIREHIATGEPFFLCRSGQTMGSTSIFLEIMFIFRIITCDQHNFNLYFVFFHLVRVSEKNKCARLRRILDRMQGASASAY